MRMLAATSLPSGGIAAHPRPRPRPGRPAHPGPAGRRPPGGHARRRPHGPREPARVRPLLRAAPPRGHRPHRTSCSTSPGSPARPTSGWSACRAACDGASRSPAPSSTGPTSSCSTSRPPASIPRPASSCGTGCYELRRDGVTLVITTHYMDEAEQLCDRLVIVDGGRVVARGLAPGPRSPSTPRARWSRCATTATAPGGRSSTGSPTRSTASPASRAFPDRALVYTDDGEAAAGRLGGPGVPPRHVHVRRSTLEDVFLHLAGRTLTD